ncbi:glycosyltransferase [Roseburia faecis]|uniref:glycosyltransferase n=1 Tax=Roseburia faecis TaxID=301302 RepID=UPI003F94D03A
MKNILVIMASYNGEKYIEEQLDSIWNQKNVNISILVRDDGSEDKTCKILDKYKKAGKLQWYKGEHLNIAKGYFDLMKKAITYDLDYIAFADQDDRWDEDKLNIAVDRLEKCNNRPALYYSGQRLVDEKLNLIALHELNSQRNLYTRFILSDFAGCTGVFNRQLLSEILKYEPKYMLMHDTWILKVCLGLGGIVCVDREAHLDYRQHGNNSLGLGRGLIADLKQVRQYLYEYNVEAQMKELLQGYGNRMIKEYRKLAEACCIYKYNKKARELLLNKEIINFYNKGLNLTYDLKVMLNKL